MGAVLIGHNIKNLVPGVHGSTFGGNPLSCAAAIAALGVIESTRRPEVVGGLGGGPWLDGRMRMAHAAIGYAASALESKVETYANVARITLDAISAYAEDVRASRQIKGGIPVKPAG